MRGDTVSLDEIGEELVSRGRGAAEAPTADQFVEAAHARALLEHAIDALPENFRMVFVLRVVEGLDVRETAECLELNASTVRTRLFRAQRQLRSELSRPLQGESSEIFDFGAERCDRVVERVLARLPPDRGDAQSQQPPARLARAGSLHPPQLAGSGLDSVRAHSRRELLERDHRRTLDGLEHDGRGDVAHAGTRSRRRMVKSDSASMSRTITCNRKSISPVMV